MKTRSMQSTTPASILIVDDEPRNIQLLANLLRESGYEIEYATSGSMALQWIQSRFFDLVLLDVLMPVIDGFEVCRRIKSGPSRDIPVIFLTARTDTPGLLEGFALGAADYIEKPFHKEELLARVNAHITLARQRQELNRYAHLLEEKTRQLEIENASKDKFFSILAHDLRNPLIGILDFARLLDDIEHIQPVTLRQMKIEFHTSAERLLAMVDNLLTWSRAQRGLIVPRPTAIPLQIFVQSRIRLLSHGAQNKGIHLYNRVSELVNVWCDPDMLGTILDNLITNAIKFTPSGGQVEISTSLADDMQLITISDTGIGIEMELLENIFSVGVRTQRQGTSGEKGSGLGLTLCSEFVVANGGKIWVESQPGQGSRFSFTLPIPPSVQTI